jgi:hypothetical protein
MFTHTFDAAVAAARVHMQSSDVAAAARALVRSPPWDAPAAWEDAAAVRVRVGCHAMRRRRRECSCVLPDM